MNPKLIKFMVELQNSEKTEKKEKIINFKRNINSKFINILRTEKVTIPIEKNI